MKGWPTDWLQAGWLTRLTFGICFDWVKWLTFRPTCWLTDWQPDCKLVGSLIYWLQVDWLTQANIWKMFWFSDWLTDTPTNWLTDWLTASWLTKIDWYLVMFWLICLLNKWPTHWPTDCKLVGSLIYWHRLIFGSSLGWVTVSLTVQPIDWLIDCSTYWLTASYCNTWIQQLTGWLIAGWLINWLTDRLKMIDWPPEWRLTVWLIDCWLVHGA